MSAHQHEHPAHSHGQSSHSHEDAEDGAAQAGLAELLDLDGQVLHGYWSELFGSVHQAAAGIDCAQILDLGAGSGVGTLGLAARFDQAQVIAVDSSPEMLSRIRAKAGAGGLADRVRTVQADLDDGLPPIGPIDLTWASMSLHHLAEPDRILAELFATTRPDGLIAVAELVGMPRLLPDDLGIGRPGLEARCLAAMQPQREQDLPHLDSPWPDLLTAAGFTVIDARTIQIEQDAPHPPGTARYAQLWLDRLRCGLAEQLDADDLATLDTLIDGTGPESLAQRGDLQLRATRSFVLAQRR